MGGVRPDGVRLSRRVLGIKWLLLAAKRKSGGALSSRAPWIIRGGDGTKNYTGEAWNDVDPARRAERGQ